MKKNKILSELNAILKSPIDPLHKFHDLTKFKKWGPFPPVDKWPKSWRIVFFKEYPRLDKVFLPDPELRDINLKDVLYMRRSSRAFSKGKMKLEQISNLLFYAAGMRENKKPWMGTRFYPSPGGRYTLETYVVSLNSELPNGVYHYNVRDHCLEILRESTKFKRDYYVNQDWVYEASILIFFTVIFQRNTIKYGWRGYRHVMQEAGHLGQNFYLLSGVFGLLICGIGGYVDDRINKLLDVDGLEETVIYALAIGGQKDHNEK